MRNLLSELAAIAHERELGAHLQKLSQAFAQWKCGELKAWDVDDAVHQFANGFERRRLYTRYNTKSILHMNVAQAIVRGILRPTEVPDEVITVLKDAIAFYEKGLADSSISFDEQD